MGEFLFFSSRDGKFGTVTQREEARLLIELDWSWFGVGGSCRARLRWEGCVVVRVDEWW